MILCIGPKGAGKTLLLRKLQQADPFNNPFDSIFATIPTMGVNITTVKTEKHKNIQINELGGSMAPIWPMHYEGTKGVIFVIDVANLMQISCACVLLLETLKHNLLKSANFLIVLNKTDIDCSNHLSEIKALLRLDDICLHSEQTITVIECSCLTGKGIASVKNWLLQCTF